MITKTTVVKAIQQFLVEQNLKKSGTDRKKLENASLSESEKEALLKKIAEYDEKYRFDFWVENAAMVMAKQLYFGTHISRGIHSSSKGDNVNFQSDSTLPNTLVGSQSIPKLELDANGNAAALPLAGFFNVIVDEGKNTTLKELLLNDDSCLEGCFADDPELSKQYKICFQNALKGDLTKPSTDERNKQLLWANNPNPKDDNYACLIPLYPSSLTNYLYYKINQLRYSDSNKQASSNRYKRDEIQFSYISSQNIGVTVLGGTKPQNVSQLTSNQGGRNYLLPSLPPIFKSQEKIRLTEKQTTIFNRRLAFACREGLNMLYEVVEAEKNIYPERDKRKFALELIAQTVLMQAKLIQNHYSAGWSKDYHLNEYQKYWLDPRRAELDGEDNFKHNIEQNHWTAEIIRQFALWINACLKWRFKSIQQDFTTPEYHQWCRDMEKAIAEQARLTK
ncbi:type I-F CRISPR-associated protein Csy1 [Aggregatibacter actinomycetemcomitans]|uniref:type I-F CRISPR-associated protein Csy1 n=1 Tax=Aggregatibacter actinomycetemcomitans TaxID=714 RepID=UPI00197B7FC4|nr:type I-F CRISPR-associated protein Csy1 [Aggregatibacter actinomycetemcomitans]MBN6062850.1 type I-F CRISPR-associated protein Csy1 [Aggregatibacter actinomycetemcomitans]MBN6080931.1 type I-F CRISPR-associated protein Csy1 [Aggregatibacter actinomycetemcomitans]MBN6082744.1 type I-F CRISPR-associated protein Csy1 [Aggregatibacter actinomycetemcomitans]